MGLVYLRTFYHQLKPFVGINMPVPWSFFGIDSGIKTSRSIQGTRKGMRKATSLAARLLTLKNYIRSEISGIESCGHSSLFKMG